MKVTLLGDKFNNVNFDRGRHNRGRCWTWQTNAAPLNMKRFCSQSCCHKCCAWCDRGGERRGALAFHGHLPRLLSPGASRVVLLEVLALSILLVIDENDKEGDVVEAALLHGMHSQRLRGLLHLQRRLLSTIYQQVKTGSMYRGSCRETLPKNGDTLLWRQCVPDAVTCYIRIST